MQQDATPESWSDSLTSKQERAIDALLQGETLSQTAQTVGVDRSTIHRWSAQPEFAASLNRRRLAMRDASMSRLQRLQELSIETMEGAIKQGNEQAALAVLRGTGLLNGQPAEIGPTHPDGVRREQLAKENSDRLDDLINSMSL